MGAETREGSKAIFSKKLNQPITHPPHVLSVLLIFLSSEHICNLLHSLHI
jgi:hypothetical protein